MAVNKVGSSKNFYLETNEPTNITVPAGAYLPGTNYATTLVDASNNLYPIDPNSINPVYIKDTLQSIDSISFTAPDVFNVDSNTQKTESNVRGLSFFKATSSEEFVFLDNNFSIDYSETTSSWSKAQGQVVPSVVFSTSGQIPGTDSSTVLLSGVLENDVILITTFGDDAAFSLPSGYTQITSSTLNTVYYNLFYKVATSTPDTSVTLTVPAGEGEQSAYIIYVIRGVSLTGGVPSYTLSTIATGTTVPAIASITNTSYDPKLLVFTVAVDDDNVSGSAPGYENFLVQSASAAGGTLFAGTKKLVYNESSANTLSTTGNDDWVSYSILFNGAVSSGISCLAYDSQYIYAGKFGAANLGKIYYGSDISSITNSSNISINKRPVSIIGSVSAVGTTSVTLNWASLSPQIGDVVVVSVGSDGGAVGSPGGDWVTLNTAVTGTQYTGTYAIRLASVSNSAAFSGATSMAGVAVLLRPNTSQVFDVATRISVAAAVASSGNGVSVTENFLQDDVAIRVTHVDDDNTATGATITGATGYSTPLFYNATAVGQSLSIAWKTFTASESETATLSTIGVNDEVVSKAIKISGDTVDPATTIISSIASNGEYFYILTSAGDLLESANPLTTSFDPILTLGQSAPTAYSKTYSGRVMFWSSNKAIVVRSNNVYYQSTLPGNITAMAYFSGYYYALLSDGTLYRSEFGESWLRIYNSPSPEIIYQESATGLSGSASINFSGQPIKDGDLLVVAVMTDGDEANVPTISINDDGVGWITVFNSNAASANDPHAKIHYAIANENTLPGQVTVTAAGATGTIIQGYVIRGIRPETSIRSSSRTETGNLNPSPLDLVVSQNYRSHMVLSFVFVDDNIATVTPDDTTSYAFESTVSVTGATMYTGLSLVDSEYSQILSTPSYSIVTVNENIVAAISIPTYSSKINDLVNLSGSRLVAVGDGGVILSTDNILTDWQTAEGINLSLEQLDDVHNALIDGTRIVAMGSTGNVYYNDEQTLRLLLIGQGSVKQL